MKNATTTERKSDRELVSHRVINGPVRLVWQAWTTSELFARWWVPKSFPVVLHSCVLDVRQGGSYRLEFKTEGGTMPFFGRYLEVVPHARLVWTNDEGGPEAMAISTVTFEERDGKTLITMSDLHPTKAACDEAISGSASGTAETFEQLDQFVSSMPR